MPQQAKCDESSGEEAKTSEIHNILIFLDFLTDWLGNYRITIDLGELAQSDWVNSPCQMNDQNKS